MTDDRTPAPADETEAIFAEIDKLLGEWGLLIDEQLATAQQMLDVAAIDEEWSC